MTTRLNINADQIVAYTNKLEKMHKSALPVAIRGTLNDAAFAMKKNNMPKIARQMFEERQPNFFKANSRAEPAQGFDINKMVAQVGFVSSGLHSPSTNYAVRDLEKQEHSGTIKGRSFKPLPGARIGGTGNVRSNWRIAKLLKAGNVVNAKDSTFMGTGKNGKMQQFIKASIHAGVGGYVLGGKLMWRVVNLKRIGRNIQFKKQKLYSFNKQGVAKIKTPHGFMRKAAEEVQKEMEFFFRLQAYKQFKKAGLIA